MSDARAHNLRAALGFLSLEPREPELQLLHRCFDAWRGIGDVVAGMARQEYDLELRRYNGRGWRAMFFLSGFEHSLTADAGSGWAPSPWEAVAHAAAHVAGVNEVTDVRARWIGHRLHADVSVSVPPELSAAEGHAIAKEVRHQLLHHLPHLGGVAVHVDPFGQGGEDFHRIGEHTHDDLPMHRHD